MMDKLGRVDSSQNLSPFTGGSNVAHPIEKDFCGQQDIIKVSERAVDDVMKTYKSFPVQPDPRPYIKIPRSYQPQHEVVKQSVLKQKIELNLKTLFDTSEQGKDKIFQRNYHVGFTNSKRFGERNNTAHYFALGYAQSMYEGYDKSQSIRFGRKYSISRVVFTSGIFRGSSQLKNIRQTLEDRALLCQGIKNTLNVAIFYMYSFVNSREQGLSNIEAINASDRELMLKKNGYVQVPPSSNDVVNFAYTSDKLIDDVLNGL
jgi:hypothetical protein